jgi:hypothetical protein
MRLRRERFGAAEIGILGGRGADPELRVLDPAALARRAMLRQPWPYPISSGFFSSGESTTGVMGPDKGSSSFLPVFGIYCNGLFARSASASFSLFWGSKGVYDRFCWDCKKNKGEDRNLSTVLNSNDGCKSFQLQLFSSVSSGPEFFSFPYPLSTKGKTDDFLLFSFLCSLS